MTKQEPKSIHEGLITESLSNGMFRVHLDNEDLIIGYISGKIRRSFIRILPGDRVKVAHTSQAMHLSNSKWIRPRKRSDVIKNPIPFLFSL